MVQAGQSQTKLTTVAMASQVCMTTITVHGSVAKTTAKAPGRGPGRGFGLPVHGFCLHLICTVTDSATGSTGLSPTTHHLVLLCSEQRGWQQGQQGQWWQLWPLHFS